METRGPSIVLKTHKSLLARDTRLLADGIVDVRTMGSYKTWTGLWTGFWTGLWNACELSFKLVEMQVEMLKTAVV